MKKLDSNKLVLIISVLVFLDIFTQAIYFHMSWKNDIITAIISFVGNMTNLFLYGIIPLLFIYSVYSLFKKKTYLLFIINSLSLIIMLTT